MPFVMRMLVKGAGNAGMEQVRVLYRQKAAPLGAAFEIRLVVLELTCSQCLINISDDVVDMFNANG